MSALFSILGLTVVLTGREMRLIQSGPLDAKLVIVGEAPGATEEQTGIPFSGASGADLNKYLSKVGICRDDVFVTNVVHVRPPVNKFEALLKPQPSADVLRGIVRLRQDIMTIRPNLVLALGDVPLRILTNRQSITKYRGSVLESTLVPGQKVMGTFHPAAAFRQYELKALIQHDMERVAEEVRYPDIRLPQRDIRVWPDGSEWVEEMFRAEWLSVDIETTQGEGRHEIVCVGFSDVPSRALVVPMPAGDSVVRRLLASPAKKCGQNFGQYDLTVLEDNGYEVRNFQWDTMFAHHALLLESAGGGDEVKALRGKSGAKSPFSRGLAFQVSLYTREPYYKDDGKLWKIDSGDIQQFYRYNGKDAACTLEIRSVQDRELDEFGVRHVFEHEMRMLPLLRQMSRRGVRIDTRLQDEMREQLETEIENLQSFLDRAAGEPVNVKSPPQMQRLLYEKLGLPVKLHRETRRPTANKDAIVELSSKHTHPVLMAILEIRKRRDLLERYINAGVDPDGRMRCLFDPAGTRTGRLASRANIYGSGTNLQNIPPAIRRMFVADPGKMMFYVDLSQAEARVVAYLARCERLIELFESGRDIHKENAIRFFGAYDESKRITVKRIVHGSNYGEGPDRIIKVAAADGVRLLREEVVRGQEAYFLLYPEIKEVWWAEVERELRASRTLTTPLGWKRQFYGRWDSVNFLNEALAFQPQSTVGVLAEMGMLAASQVPGAEILLNEHDAVLGQCDEDAVDEVVPAVRRAMEIPISIFGKTLVIPAEAKIGRNWGEQSEDNPDGLHK